MVKKGFDQHFCSSKSSKKKASRFLTHQSYFMKIPKKGKEIISACGGFLGTKLVVVSVGDGRMAQPTFLLLNKFTKNALLDSRTTTEYKQNTIMSLISNKE
jgi:hypothetical protein